MSGHARDWHTKGLLATPHTRVPQSCGCLQAPETSWLEKSKLFPLQFFTASLTGQGLYTRPPSWLCPYCEQTDLSLSTWASVTLFESTRSTLWKSEFSTKWLGWVPDGFYSFSSRAGLGTRRENSPQTRLLFLLNPLSFEPAQ